MAHQSDWQKYATAFADWQARGGPMPQAVRDMRRQQGQARDAELRAKGYGPSRLDTVNAAISKQMASFEKDRQKAVNMEIANRAPKHARLQAVKDSSVFDDLTWKDGVATATFFRGGQLVYEYEMTREEFIDWVSADSLGAYFNDNVR